VRRRRSRAEVEALVAEFEASGLLRAAFCQQRGLAVGTLDKSSVKAKAQRSNSRHRTARPSGRSVVARIGSTP